MWPDRVSNPGPLTYESGALPIALHGPAMTKMAAVPIYGKTPSKIFSRTSGKIAVQIALRGPAMTKMAAVPIYGKTPSKIFSRTSGNIAVKLGIKHRG